MSNISRIRDMKTTIINTYDRARAAAIASSRLFQALLNSGHEVAMPVNEKNTEQHQIEAVNNNLLSKKIAFLRFTLERLFLFL